jgi:hypothetical protein
MVNKINKEERFLFNLNKNMKQEHVHIKFCKFSLGKYLYPFALSIGTLFTLNIVSWSFPVLLNTI